MAKKVKTKAEIKKYLKDKGHKAKDVDGELDSKSIAPALRKLHGIADDEYRIAGGRL